MSVSFKRVELTDVSFLPVQVVPLTEHPRVHGQPEVLVQHQDEATADGVLGKGRHHVNYPPCPKCFPRRERIS